MRTQKVGESLQDFAVAVEQLGHGPDPTLPENHMRMEAGKAFVDGVADPDIKIRLLLGGEKTLTEALRHSITTRITPSSQAIENL
jgi:hypothetical protein